MPSNLHKPAVAMLSHGMRRLSFFQSDRLDNQFFALTLAFAFVLHVAGLYAWWVAPRTPVIDIPVRALNVKLGGDDAVHEESIREARSNSNNKVVEHTIARLVRLDEKPADKPAKKITKPEAKPEPAVVEKKIDATAPKQFVRSEPQAPSTPQISDLADSDSPGGKELLSRYEQLISLWIQKFKQYPDEARRQGMQGKTMVRIRIDRRGNIHYWELENSTGYALLDRAAIDMVKRANPVPAVPNNYPAGEQFDFLIPVNFRLE